MTMASLHVGLVGPLPPPNGGMAMQTKQLIGLLTQEGVKVTHLATNPPYRPKFVGRLKGIRAVFRLLPYGLSAWKLAGEVDVIHIMANSGWSWQLFTAPVVWLASLRHTPVIVNYRGGEALSYFQKSFARVRPTLARAHSVVVPSGFLQEVFKGFEIDSNVIPNIIDQSRFFPSPKKREEGRFTLIVTRNLEAIYGIDMAIRAVALLQGKIDKLELKVAGSGPQLAELESLASDLGVHDTVHFVGRIERDDMCGFYHSADLMLSPTTVDNMPNSVLEAMACGVAVVSTNVGGVPYIVKDGETALLVESGKEQQMAEAILRLYHEHNTRNKMIDAGLAEVAQYGWANVRNLWLGIYQRAAEGK